MLIRICNWRWRFLFHLISSCTFRTLLLLWCWNVVHVATFLSITPSQHLFLLVSLSELFAVVNTKLIYWTIGRDWKLWTKINIALLYITKISQTQLIWHNLIWYIFWLNWTIRSKSTTSFEIYNKLTCVKAFLLTFSFCYALCNVYFYYYGNHVNFLVLIFVKY